MNDKDEKIELALDRLELVEETEPAAQPDVELAAVRVASDSPAVVTTSDQVPAADGESEYAVKLEPAVPKLASLPNGASPAKGAASTKTVGAASPRRTKLHPWLRNPNVLLGAAIVVGGLAAVLVGNLVLWMVKPAPKPPKSRYGAVHHEHCPSISFGAQLASATLTPCRPFSPSLSSLRPCASAVNDSA